MKKFILALLIVVVATALTSKVSAQYSIPSYYVTVIVDPITFEETPIENVIGFGNVLMGVEKVIQNSRTLEERQIVVMTNGSDAATSAWVVIIIYSLDNTINYGPYTVNEGMLLK